MTTMTAPWQQEFPAGKETRNVCRQQQQRQISIKASKHQSFKASKRQSIKAPKLSIATLILPPLEEDSYRSPVGSHNKDLDVGNVGIDGEAEDTEVGEDKAGIDL